MIHGEAAANSAAVDAQRLSVAEWLAVQAGSAPVAPPYLSACSLLTTHRSAVTRPAPCPKSASPWLQNKLSRLGIPADKLIVPKAGDARPELLRVPVSPIQSASSLIGAEPSYCQKSWRGVNDVEQ